MLMAVTTARDDMPGTPANGYYLVVLNSPDGFRQAVPRIAECLANFLETKRHFLRRAIIPVKINPAVKVMRDGFGHGDMGLKPFGISHPERRPEFFDKPAGQAKMIRMKMRADQTVDGSATGDLAQ